MDPESKKLLEETFRLAEENNKILHSMRRSMMWARVMTILYWALIIGSAVGAYYFLQPYIDQAMSVYGNAKSSLDSFGSMFRN